MTMTEKDLRDRTKAFALRIVRLFNALPSSGAAQVIGRQVLRSGTSIGANYRAACKAKSLADFIFKLSIVEEEADETIYWLELLMDARIMQEKKLKTLCAE